MHEEIILRLQGTTTTTDFQFVSRMSLLLGRRRWWPPLAPFQVVPLHKTQKAWFRSSNKGLVHKEVKMDTEMMTQGHLHPLCLAFSVSVTLSGLHTSLSRHLPLVYRTIFGENSLLLPRHRLCGWYEAPGGGNCAKFMQLPHSLARWPVSCW